MTVPGRTVGSVNVRVLPNTANFAPSLQRYLQRMERQLVVNLNTNLDLSGARDELERFREEASRGGVVIRASTDTAAARAEIRALIAEVGRAHASVNVGVNRGGASAQLSQIASLANGATEAGGDDVRRDRAGGIDR